MERKFASNSNNTVEISYSEGKNCRISEGKISSPEVRKKNFRKLNLKIPHNFGRSLERKR